MASVYGAHPLAIGESTVIRLIELLRAENGLEDPTAPISCRLRVVALNDTPRYTALSYVWGAPEPVMTIVMDEHTTAIRGNCGTSCMNIEEMDKGISSGLMLSA